MEKIKLTPKRKEIIERMGFSNINSILRYYPYRYDIYKDDTLGFTLHDKKVSVEGTITGKVKIEHLPKKLIKTTFMLKTKNDQVNIVMFNRLVSTSYLFEGNNLVVSGKYNALRHEITVASFFVGKLDGKDRYVPIYSLPSDIRDATYKSFIKYILEANKANDYVKPIIPDDMTIRYKLVDINTALENIHIPESSEMLNQSYRYLKYEEFLTFCGLGYLKRKMLNLGNGKHKKYIDYQLINSFISSLPFKLTNDQMMAKDEILHDIISNVGMSRLLQGDVGSGKTIVGVIAMIANCSSGYQSALMAPTDILATQHYEDIKGRLEKFGFKVELLVQDLPAARKNMVIDGIMDGSINIVIGTHALISQNIRFKKLGLAIIDEQHRFGVKQRVALKEKGVDIDILYMSATPIPRTLASTIYMDMDVSTIAVYPYKERKVKTFYINDNSIIKVKDFIIQYLENKKQIYVVCPSIEESKLEIENVKSIYNKWKKTFPNYNIALMHGKLKSDVKDKVMDDFKDGKIDVLISTTVIEVGINVFNANMMIIYNAERFGLAQIHQLRGRIARDGNVGYCYLLSNSEDDDIKDRLTFIQDNSDGFKISEYDLKNRGAGDMLGLAQSGKSPFVIANLIDDFNILKVASDDIRYIMSHKERYEKFIQYLHDLLREKPKYID